MSEAAPSTLATDSSSRPQTFTARAYAAAWGTDTGPAAGLARHGKHGPQAPGTAATSG